MAHKSRIWNFFDGLKGDKVVWMIVLMLIMWSAVCIFSSTSTTREVLSGTQTRVDVIVDLLKIIGLGVGLMLLCYNFIGVRGYRFCAQFGFLVSALMLLIVVSHFQGIPFFRAGQINGAWRVIKVGSFQIHIYEIIKVAMVMYLAWAVDAFNRGRLPWIKSLSAKEHFHWLARKGWQKVLLIYVPMFFVIGCVALGSGSSAAFLSLLMFATILVGGLSVKELIPPVLLLIGIIAGILLINKATDGSMLEGTRFDTWVHRIEGNGDDVERFKQATPGSIEYYDALDDIRQPYSAKIAIKQGGLLGKGAGQSTQRYIVPVMYEDFMFSFIVEEYGLFGAIVVIILYVSLVARGAVIVRNCNDDFGKITVAGLVLLISGQAMMHMMVNAGIGPQTGQTLPLISYGSSSFVVFCIAFGIILSISRMAAGKIKDETNKAEPLALQHEGSDEVQGGLDMLDDFESELQ